MIHVREAILDILKANVALTTVDPAVPVNRILAVEGRSQDAILPRILITFLSGNWAGMESPDDNRIQISAFTEESQYDAELIANKIEDALKDKRLQPEADGSEGKSWTNRRMNRTSVPGDSEYAVHLEYRVVATRL